MKIINCGILIAAIVLTFVALYFWLVKCQINFAAFYFALSAMAHSVYVHATKADKAE